MRARSADFKAVRAPPTIRAVDRDAAIMPPFFAFAAMALERETVRLHHPVDPLDVHWSGFDEGDTIGAGSAELHNCKTMALLKSSCRRNDFFNSLLMLLGRVAKWLGETQIKGVVIPADRDRFQ
jgi:hypothetical protein